jgi:hypothetical protein
VALHGANVGLLIDGFNMAPYFRSFEMEAIQGFHDSTTFGNSSRLKTPGLKDGKASGTAFLDTTATVGSLVVLKGKYTGASPGTNNSAIISHAPNGLALGSPVNMGYFPETSLGIRMPIDELEVLEFAGDADQDAIDFGVSLHALSAETSFTFTGTAVDGGAASANGGVAHLHVTAIAGADPEIVVKVQHSVDGSTSWADLVTFNGSSAANTALRVEVAVGTTVRRYLRIMMTENGTTTSITAVVCFARR